MKSFAQTDFSDQWEDFYSYNNVKDFTIVEDRIYAIADNAVFIYEIQSQNIQKFSSVHGLSGKNTSAIFYSKSLEKFVVGYTTGLIEIIDEKGAITIANDIERLDITGNKSINHIAENNGLLYLSTPFGIVEYDLNLLQFGDTFFIDEGSNPVYVNETIIFDNYIYALSQKGIFIADIDNPNLIDFNNWLQPIGNLLGNFTSATNYGGKLIVSKGTSIHEIKSLDQLNWIKGYTAEIINLKSSSSFLNVTFLNKAFILDQNFNEVASISPTNEFNFTLNTSYTIQNKIFLGTQEFGILETSFAANQFTEIHPEGPQSNEVFSLTAENENLWIVYGGHNEAFTPLGKKSGYSHYDGLNDQWINTNFNNSFPALDLVDVTIDPDHLNRVYISSWNSGVLVVEDDQPLILWDDSNSGLEDLNPPGSSSSSIRISSTAIDNQDNLWVANAWVPNRLKKRNSNGNWKAFDLSSILTNEAFGLTELIVDKTNNVWIGSRRNGALVYNETGDRKRALLPEASKGSLPDPNVRTVVADKNNRIWIGTKKGLVVFNNAASLFELDVYDANPIIIEDQGIPKKLLGDQPVNSIAIDGADNKWFGTDTGGVLGTNSFGTETFYNFNKNNSPLPSNRILKIAIDKSLGKVFFATDKGIVAFNNNVAPYGESLAKVYAYPNPVLKNHESVTIDGRNGNHLPRGTNVKILDTAGRLVYETNVVESQSFNGGKVIWNKMNLGGRKVASGVYIVLLTSPDQSESTSTKIAIIN